MATLETCFYNSFDCDCSYVGYGFVCQWSLLPNRDEWLIELLANDHPSFCTYSYHYIFIESSYNVWIQDFKVIIFEFTLPFEAFYFRRSQFCALLISFGVIAINFYFSIDFILNQFGTRWFVFLIMAGPILLYLSFVIYLICVSLVTMEICVSDLFNNVSLLI